MARSQKYSDFDRAYEVTLPFKKREKASHIICAILLTACFIAVVADTAVHHGTHLKMDGHLTLTFWIVFVIGIYFALNLLSIILRLAESVRFRILEGRCRKARHPLRCAKSTGFQRACQRVSSAISFFFLDSLTTVLACLVGPFIFVLFNLRQAFVKEPLDFFVLLFFIIFGVAFIFVLPMYSTFLEYCCCEHENACLIRSGKAAHLQEGIDKGFRLFNAAPRESTRRLIEAGIPVLRKQFRKRCRRSINAPNAAAFIPVVPGALKHRKSHAAATPQQRIGSSDRSTSIGLPSDGETF